MFEQIEKARILVQFKGGLKILPVYKRLSNNRLYAKNGQYFVHICAGGVMGSNLTWLQIECPYHSTENGYLVQQ